jgi:hypothetical protein
MDKKNHKNIYTAASFLIFLCFCFFYFGIKKVFGLEVDYPTAGGQSLQSSNADLPTFMLYLFKAGMFIGFVASSISLVVAGAMFLLAPAKPDLRAEAKDRVSGALSGLLILVLTYLILTTINPQLTIFTFGARKIPATTQQSNSTATPPPPPGAYFYKDPTCSDTKAEAKTTDVSDFGSLKTGSVKMVQGTDNQNLYGAVLYDSKNFQGKCQYVMPGQACMKIPFFAASASIFNFSSQPNGDGVYFYRRSFFDPTGGSYKVSNGQIGLLYAGELSQMQFQGVPEDEKPCVKYDIAGNCTSRVSPTLGGENISSVKIVGPYEVLFIYSGPDDNNAGPWTSCQIFPAPNDVNKTGPIQIKWLHIRNSSNAVPNYVVIFPVQ